MYDWVHRNIQRTQIILIQCFYVQQTDYFIIGSLSIEEVQDKTLKFSGPNPDSILEDPSDF